MEAARPIKPHMWQVAVMWFAASYLDWQSWRELSPLLSDGPLESPVHAYALLATALLSTSAAVRMTYGRWCAQRKRVTRGVR